MSYFRYATTGPLELFEIRSKTSDKVLTYRVLFLSPVLERELPFDRYPRLRVEGEIEDVAVQVALQPSGSRGHYVMVSPTVCKTLGLRPGDEVAFRFNIAAQDAVQIPAELEQAIASSRKRRALWDALTPGRQRGIAHLVASAKTLPTRLKRVELAFDELERGVIERSGPRRAAAGSASTQPKATRQSGAMKSASKARHQGPSPRPGEAPTKTRV